MNFSGFVALGDTFIDFLQVTDDEQRPVVPDSTPYALIYGPSGLLAGVTPTVTAGHSGSITGATNATPIVITSANHGLQTGQVVAVSGVGGNTAANGTFPVVRVNANTFQLAGSVGDGDYTSGGTFALAGFYRVSIPALGASGFEAGEHYAIHYTFAISSFTRHTVNSMGVV